MLRDPNRPRGNPLFDEADSTSFDVDARRARHPRLSAVPTGATEEEPEGEEPGGEATEPEEPTGGATGRTDVGVGGLLDALVDAGPETAEHLLRAVNELLLAAQTVIAAAERGLEQRGEAEPSAPDADAPTSAEGDRPGRVRHIDLD